MYTEKSQTHREKGKDRRGLGNGCKLYKKCGGCQLQNMTYPEQLSFKQVKAIKYLGKFCHVEEIIGMDEPFHYRNKVQSAFGRTRGGKIISGVYQSSSHRIVCVDDCKIEDRTADRIIVTIRKMLVDFGLQPYDEDSGAGFLRHVLIRRGFTTGEVMVVLVTGSPVFKYKNAFLRKLLDAYPEITTVVQNINSKSTSLVLGETQKVLYGNGYITDILCGCKFRISPKSFYQINPVQTEKLYNIAIDFAALSGNQTVIDAYCGIGTIGIAAARSAGKVIGVEINRDAFKDAIVNARLNGVENIRFFCEDAGKFMTEMAAHGERADVVFMDPPRAGSDEAFLSSLIKLKPKKVVYISCNVETQARDISYLVKNGYACKRVQPVDMFPQTEHVETVCLLSKLNVKQDTETVVEHYDALIDEGNDPVHDPKPLQEYMDKWDGADFIEQMRLSSKKAVLEIGVGTGRLAVHTAPLCSVFYGIDISPKTIERAKKNLLSYKNVTLICADFLSYKFNRSFDIVYSSLTFMHIKQKLKAVKKAAELLSKGGIFVLSIDKNPAEFIDFGTRKIKIYPDKPEEIESYIKAAGLTELNRYNTEFATIFVAQKER